jgi:uncharacterized protein YjbI with pentapeptide repeats
MLSADFGAKGRAVTFNRTIVKLQGNGYSLTAANLTGATVDQTNLTGANLTGANLTGATCPDGTSSTSDANGCTGHLSP